MNSSVRISGVHEPRASCKGAPLGPELAGVQAARAKAACVGAGRGGETYSSLQNAGEFPVGRECVWEAFWAGLQVWPSLAG